MNFRSTCNTSQSHEWLIDRHIYCTLHPYHFIRVLFGEKTLSTTLLVKKIWVPFLVNKIWNISYKNYTIGILFWITNPLEYYLLHISHIFLTKLIDYYLQLSCLNNIYFLDCQYTNIAPGNNIYYLCFHLIDAQHIHTNLYCYPTLTSNKSDRREYLSS
jgi:hypothetical protein